LSNAFPVVLQGFSINDGDYQINQSLQNSCEPGLTLSPGSLCFIDIDFTPSRVTKGQTDLGTLTIQTNAEKVKKKGSVVTLMGGGKPG
jgi:hypothetical protein